MRPPAETLPARVALVAVPESSVAVLYGLHEVFAAVGGTWESLTGEPALGRPIRTQIIAAGRAPFAAALGRPVVPDLTFPETAGPGAEPDVVLVGDLALDPGADPRGRWPEACEWLRARHAAGALVCSVCTGSVLLAEAGLLDGLEATTHWGVRGLFRAHYPRVRLRPEHTLLPAGQDSRVITSGGSASWSDLALYLVARLSGRAEAVRIARLFLFGDRGDGQLPFAAMPRPPAHDDAVVAECQRWIAGHYDLPNAVSRMTAHSGLPERTFKRRFRKATGYAPIDYVQALRVEEAKHMLETTAEPTDAVGASVGYEDPASFRRVFKRLAGITPAHYRQRFRGIGSAAGIGP